MTITNYAQTRLGNLTTVTVTTDLLGTVWLHWYRDGALVSSGQSLTHTFLVESGAQARIEVLDTTDAEFDPIAEAPASYPARRSLWWCRSLSTDLKKFRVEQKEAAGAWATLGEVPANAIDWSFSWLTGRLDDLTEYTWRIIPIDAVGNEGTPLVLGPELILRVPDAPSYTVTVPDAGCPLVES
ncbi:MAG: hypothetical protein IMZ54_00450 [Acidobacteria bacterium]|nr:hypothetical protein [Acidobacteriota bacterium]